MIYFQFRTTNLKGQGQQIKIFQCSYFFQSSSLSRTSTSYPSFWVDSQSLWYSLFEKRSHQVQFGCYWDSFRIWWGSRCQYARSLLMFVRMLKNTPLLLVSLKKSQSLKHSSQDGLSRSLISQIRFQKEKFISLLKKSILWDCSQKKYQSSYPAIIPLLSRSTMRNQYYTLWRVDLSSSQRMKQRKSSQFIFSLSDLKVRGMLQQIRSIAFLESPCELYFENSYLLIRLFRSLSRSQNLQKITQKSEYEKKSATLLVSFYSSNCSIVYNNLLILSSLNEIFPSSLRLSLQKILRVTVSLYFY